MSGAPEIHRLTTPQDLFRAAADEVIRAVKQAVRERNRFTIALAGGSTPKGLYTLLAANADVFPWDRMFLFWGDERHVPPNDPQSNFRMAQEALLSRVPVPAQNVFRIPAENPDANAAAAAYEQSLRKFFDVHEGEFPSFDFILLGLGPDGHTASLFPETAALEEKTCWVVANWVEKLRTHRITLTLPVLNAARIAAFLVSGTDKAAILHQILEDKDNDKDEDGNKDKDKDADEKYPARLVRPKSGKVIWFVDRAAASELAPAA